MTNEITLDIFTIYDYMGDAIDMVLAPTERDARLLWLNKRDLEEMPFGYFIESVDD